MLDLIIDRSISLVDFLLSLIAWESIGNSNWFIYAILCTYVFSFLGLSLFKGNLQKALIFIVVKSVVYIAIVSCYKNGYWYDTILAFPLGCYFSLKKEWFEKLICRKYVLLGGVLSILLLFIAKAAFIPSGFVNSQLALVAFSCVVVFISLHVRLNSAVLN